MRPSSLALRLTVLYACTNFVLVGGLAWLQYRTLAADLAQEDDQLLLETLTGAARGVAIRNRTGPGLSPLGPWVREVGADCQVIRGPRLPLGPPPTCPSAHGVRPAFRTWRSPAGRTWRIVSAPAAEAPDAVLEVLLDRWTDEQILRRSRRELMVLLPLAFVLSGLAGYGVARTGLAPLGRLAQRMEAVHIDTLGQPVQLPHAPAELQGVIRSLETMMARLRVGYERLAHFSSELAHELRTPVHVLRQQAEVALLTQRSPEAYREVLRSTLEELDGLRRLIEDTLFLARAEDPRASIDRQDLAARSELLDVADFLDPVAAERNIRIAVEAPDHLLLQADRMLLRRALVNLVTNAVRHTPPGGCITLRGAYHESGVTIEVQDTGVGIPTDQLPHLFDRHFRVPGEQDGQSGGTGLGLSIVRGIMRLHGGMAEIVSAVGQGTCVTLRFPRRIQKGQMTKP